MLTSRVFTSSLRTVARRSAAFPIQRQSVLRSATRRGYSSGHGGSAGAEKSSDMPWLIGSVVFTVPALAWLLSSSPSKKTSSHSHGGAPVPDEEKSPAVESGEDSSSDDSSSTSSPTPTPSESESESDSDSGDENPPTNQLPKDGNPKAAHISGQTGRQVPPTSADNSDMATNYEEKKDAQEQYKEMIRRKDTRVATSSSDVPSKKGAAEHPREDPQKGEGEGVQKGGPA
ncbi:hypothetical protein F5Y11DRAFT_280812 [Daldinia sp. FL1419]|nr:hypothetical protein F5Y11DRAFT_280812 [Daldinia sp. FL1419]